MKYSLEDAGLGISMTQTNWYPYWKIKALDISGSQPKNSGINPEKAW